MNKKAIVYTIDDNEECFLQLVLSLKSVRKFCQEPMDIYVLSSKPKPWMRNLYGARVIDVGDMVKEYGLDSIDIPWRGGSMSPMLLFRLLVPVVPALKNYDQILYLDTDTEVWSSTFFNIFSMDVSHELIGVKDSLSKGGIVRRVVNLRAMAPKGWKDDPGVFNKWEVLSSGIGKYINSGVLVFNMEKFKSTDYVSRVKYVIDRVRVLKPRYGDQDVFNIYYDIHVVDDRRYNGWGRALTAMFLRHYVGSERAKSLVYPVIDRRRPIALDEAGKNVDLGVLGKAVDAVYVLTDGSNSAGMGHLSSWFADNKVAKYTTLDVSKTNKYTGLCSIVPCADGFKPEYVDRWVGHYRAIADAISKGHEKVAVFEDTFNPVGLEKALADLPADFDVALCTGTGRFKPNTQFRANSSQGYILGKKAMAAIRRLFESMWSPSAEPHKMDYVYKWLSHEIIVKARAFDRSS